MGRSNFRSVAESFSKKNVAVKLNTPQLPEYYKEVGTTGRKNDSFKRKVEYFCDPEIEKGRKEVLHKNLNDRRQREMKTNEVVGIL